MDIVPVSFTDQDRAALVGKDAAGYTEEQALTYLVPVREKLINASKVMLASLEDIGAGIARARKEVRGGDWGKTLAWWGIEDTWARGATGWAAACEQYPILRDAVATGRLQLSAATEIGRRKSLPAAVVDAIIQDATDDSGLPVTQEDIRTIYADHAAKAGKAPDSDEAAAPRRGRGDDLGFQPPSDPALIQKRLDWLKDQGTRAAARLDKAGAQPVVMDRSSFMREFWKRLARPQPNDPIELDYLRELVRENAVAIYGGTLVGIVVPYVAPQTPEEAEALHADEHDHYTDAQRDDPETFHNLAVCSGCGDSKWVDDYGYCLECYERAAAIAGAVSDSGAADITAADIMGGHGAYGLVDENGQGYDANELPQAPA